MDSVIADLQSQLEKFFSNLDLVVDDIVIPSHNGHMEAMQYVAGCDEGSVLMQEQCGDYVAGCDEGSAHMQEQCGEYVAGCDEGSVHMQEQCGEKSFSFSSLSGLLFYVKHERILYLPQMSTGFVILPTFVMEGECDFTHICNRG